MADVTSPLSRASTPVKGDTVIAVDGISQKYQRLASLVRDWRMPAFSHEPRRDETRLPGQFARHTWTHDHARIPSTHIHTAALVEPEKPAYADIKPNLISSPSPSTVWDKTPGICRTILKVPLCCLVTTNDYLTFSLLNRHMQSEGNLRLRGTRS